MFNKPNAIVYIRRNDIIVGGKRITPGRLKISKDNLNNLEILNPDEFINQTQEFFAEHSFKGKKVLIVLDDSIVFSKTIESSDSSKDDIESVMEKYVAHMPIKDGLRAIIGYKDATASRLFATNSDLFQSLIQSLELCNIHKVVAITPSAAYAIDFTAKSAQIIDLLLADKRVRKKINFATVTPA